jgi:hypothetical protein
MWGRLTCFSAGQHSFRTVRDAPLSLKERPQGSTFEKLEVVNQNNGISNDYQ